MCDLNNCTFFLLPNKCYYAYVVIMMKVRKRINYYDLILLEKVSTIYNEKYYGKSERKILTDIYNRLNNKFVKLELEDNKKIKNIKYIKVFNFENGKVLETEMNIPNEILSDYFRNHDSCYEYRYDDEEIINLLKQLHKESIKYEDKVATDDECDIDSEEFYMEIEYDD